LNQAPPRLNQHLVHGELVLRREELRAILRAILDFLDKIEAADEATIRAINRHFELITTAAPKGKNGFETLAARCGRGSLPQVLPDSFSKARVGHEEDGWLLLGIRATGGRSVAHYWMAGRD
jgi:hypothetical protein